jgi:hypothetical protein
MQTKDKKKPQHGIRTVNNVEVKPQFTGNVSKLTSVDGAWAGRLPGRKGGPIKITTRNPYENLE